MKYTVDFSEIPDNVIPDGEYMGVIDGVTLKTSASSGSEYLLWEVYLNDERASGQKLIMMTSLSPKALWKLRDTLIGLGLEVSSIVDMEIDPDTNRVSNPSFDGRSVVATVSADEYQGRKRNRIDSLRQPTSTQPPSGQLKLQL